MPAYAENYPQGTVRRIWPMELVAGGKRPGLGQLGIEVADAQRIALLPDHPAGLNLVFRQQQIDVAIQPLRTGQFHQGAGGRQIADPRLETSRAAVADDDHANTGASAGDAAALVAFKGQVIPISVICTTA